MQVSLHPRKPETMAYTSLTDPHLGAFFAVPRRRQQLIRAGLIETNGAVVDEQTFKLSQIRYERQRQANEAALRRLLSQRDEMEASQQAVVTRTMQDIAKLEGVLRVKSGLTPRPEGGSASSGGRLVTLPPPEREREGRRRDKRGGRDGKRYRRAESAPAKSHPLSHYEPAGLTMPVTVGSHALTQEGGGERSSLATVSINSASIAELERRAGLSPSAPLRLQPLRHHGNSPYLDSQVAGAGWRGAGGRRSGDGRARRRPVSEYTTRRAMENVRRVGIAVEAFADENEHWEQMEVRMRYFGDARRVNYERDNPCDEVVVEQQHCGGNSVNVFKGDVLPGEEFSFVSQRHPGYPFSLNLYCNGDKDGRVSTCCEYKHTLNARLGGKGGNFAIVGIIGGGPCRKCVRRMMRRREKPLRGGPNEHDLYALKINVEGANKNDSHGHPGNGRSNDVRSGPNGDQSDRSTGSRAMNVHDLYALKVAVEDDAISIPAPTRNYTLVTNGGRATPGGRSDVTSGGSSDWLPVEWTTGEPRVANSPRKVSGKQIRFSSADSETLSTNSDVSQ